MGRHAVRRLSPVDLLAAVVARVEAGTGTKCVLDPSDEESPLYSVSFVGSRPGRSKTLFLDVMDVQVHAISQPSGSEGEVLAMVAALEEAMEEDVVVDASECPVFHLVRQDDMGVQTVKRDPTGEWHAIVAYELTVSYGIIAK
jgi:hypothetical protein